MNEHGKIVIKLDDVLKKAGIVRIKNQRFNMTFNY